MKALLRPLLALFAVLVLAGCFRVDGELTVSTDDTVSGEVTIALDRQSAIAQGQDPDAFVTDILDDVASASRSGVTGEPYEDGDYVGVKLTLTQTPLVQISDATSGMLQITHDGGQYVVSGDFGGLRESEQGSDNGDSDTAPWQIDLAITFPDGVTEHDGELSGSTVTWHLSEGTDTMTARGPAPGGGVSVIWIVVIVVIVALLATMVWWLLRRRYDGGVLTGLRSSGARMRQRHAAARGDATGRISDLDGDRSQE